MQTFVYRYGLAAPTENADLVYRQLRNAWEYRKDLVLIERGRRKAEREVRAVASALVIELESIVAGTDAACCWLASEIRDDRKRSRKRSETAAMRLGLAAARQKMKDVKALLFAERERLRSRCKACRAAESEENPCPHAHLDAVALRTRLDEIDSLAGGLIRGAHALSGLYWGTYLLVDRAMQASRAMPLYEKDGVTPNDPRWPTFDGGGSLGVQIQSSKTLDTKGALACTDTRLRIGEPAPEDSWLASTVLAARPPRREDSIVGTGMGRLPPGVRPDGTPAPSVRPDGTTARWVRDRARKLGVLRMRVGSDESEGPVWASWRLDYARDLPTGANITWAAVHRRMRGPHDEWSLTVTIEVDRKHRPVERAGSVVAIDVGWRKIDDELRICGWQDDAGATGELHLSSADVRALRLHQDVTSERDMAFDKICATVKRWIAGEVDAPEWMRDAASTMHAWRDKKKMVRLLDTWRTERPNRSAHEENVVEAMVAWASGDRARWAEQESRRMWGLRRRKDKYRVFAAQMAGKYETIVIEKFDLRDVAERDETGEDTAQNEVARSNRQIACVSDLRTCLIQAAFGRVVGVPAANTTRACPSCGVIEDREAAKSIRLRCDECGHEWDQDVTGAPKVLMARWRERPSNTTILGVARNAGNVAEGQSKKGQRWAKAKRMGKAKKVRINSARETTTK